MRRTKQIFQAALVGAFTGFLSGWIVDTLDGGPGIDYAPGILFGIGVVVFRGFEMKSRSRDFFLIACAYIAMSAMSFRVAVEVAINTSEWIGNHEKRLLVPGFFAGLIGSLLLVVIWQLTKLGKRSWAQWVAVVALGSVFGLLLDPAMNSASFEAVSATDSKDPRTGILFVPWQAAVAAGLLGFGLPRSRPKDD